MARAILACILILPQSYALADGFDRGLKALEKNDYDLAIASFTGHLRENPRDANAYNNRGHAYRAKKEYGKAIKDFSEAIRLDPKDGDFRNNRGHAYRDEKRADRAELRERLTRLRDEIDRAQVVQDEYRSQRQTHGHVWLFRRKPAKGTSK